MDVTEEAQLLVEKEEWVRQAAERIHRTRGIDLPAALASARWASLWIDRLKVMFQDEQPATREEVRRCIRGAKDESLEQAEGVPRYPTGVPAIRALIAVDDAFVLAYGEEGVRQLLS